MPTSDVSSWQAAAVALAIGLLIGSERERSGHGEHPAGVRTFGLAGLAGCVAALIGSVALAATIAGVAALAAVGFLRSAEPERGATTEVALILTAGLGGLATSAPALAAAAGVAAAVVLVSKQRLHTFVRQTVSDLEVTDALKFFVVAVTCYGMATLEGPLLSLKSINAIAHFTDWIVAHVHSATWRYPIADRPTSLWSVSTMANYI